MPLARVMLLLSPGAAGPALLTWVLVAEVQCMEVRGKAVRCLALLLIGVPGVATLLLAVPEEPVCTEQGEHEQEGAAGPAACTALTACIALACSSITQAQLDGAHLCQCLSLLSTAGLPTTISRALALVMATLNLCKRAARILPAAAPLSLLPSKQSTGVVLSTRPSPDCEWGCPGSGASSEEPQVPWGS